MQKKPLNTRCPKCEAHVREGARRCPMCGMPLSVMAFQAPEPVEGEPIHDPLLGLFERDEPTRCCPVCWNEFVSEMKTCGPCQSPLRVVPRSLFEAQLRFRPIFDRGKKVAHGPEDRPSDLVRVHVCKGPDEARARLKEFRFMGVRVWPGSDAFDADPDASRIGLYVRAADLESARYLLLAEPRPPKERPDGRDLRDAMERLLDDARAYFEFGKFRKVIALLEPHAGNPDADDLVSEALLRSGAVREAERRALAAAEAAAPGVGRGRLLAHAGVCAALGNDGSPFGAGARAAVARERLAAATVDAPRLLHAGVAFVEILRHLRDDAAARAEIGRLGRLNPNVLALDGYIRTQHEEMR